MAKNQKERGGVSGSLPLLRRTKSVHEGDRLDPDPGQLIEKKTNRPTG